MKKITLLFALFIQISLFAQCLPDGITFSTQAQINSFPTNYPNCTVIGGTVTISGSDITNLDSLSVLTQITGGLFIYDCSLSSISALSNLNSLGWLSVNSTSNLTDFQGLENINYLSLVELNFNWGLTSLAGLNNLDSIGGCLAVVHNESLVDLSGLNSLTYIGSCFDVNWNSNLASLSGLDSLNFIGEAFWLHTNYSLTSIEALSSLESIGGSMYIDGVGVTSLDGLDNIAPSSISWLSITNNGNLSNCNVQSICDYLTSPNGTVNIYNNADGCNSIAEVENACLVTINGVTVEPVFSVYPNPAVNKIYISKDEVGLVSELNIYNNLGQKVFHKLNVIGEIDITEIGIGMLIVEVVIDGVVYRTKLIVM